MSPEAAAPALGMDWRALVRKNGTKEFAAIFAENAVLETSVMYRALCGAWRIR